VAEYDDRADSDPDGDLRELAAESEGILGFVEARGSRSREDLHSALRRLDRAIDLTVFTDRAVSFRRAKADALAAADDLSGACAEVDEIERLSPSAPVDELRTDLGCP
jgi:hypothetical protein